MKGCNFHTILYHFLRMFSQIVPFRNWTIVDWTRFHRWTWSYSWPTSQWKSWRSREICKSFWNKTQNGQDNPIWSVQFWPTCLKKAKTSNASKHVRLFRKTGWKEIEEKIHWTEKRLRREENIWSLERAIWIFCNFWK